MSARKWESKMMTENEIGIINRKKQAYQRDSFSMRIVSPEMVDEVRRMLTEQYENAFGIVPENWDISNIGPYYYEYGNLKGHCGVKVTFHCPYLRSNVNYEDILEHPNASLSYDAKWINVILKATGRGNTTGRIEISARVPDEDVCILQAIGKLKTNYSSYESLNC